MALATLSLKSVSRSLRYQPKSYFFHQFFSLSRTTQPSLNSSATSTFSRTLTPSSHNWLYQTRRSLILDSVTYFSDSVKLMRLPGSDSGIVEVCLDRPEAKNAIGKDMLQGLQHTFEALKEDASANVVLICSLVPKVFCAGADLKERRTMTASEVHLFVNSLRSTFMSLEIRNPRRPKRDKSK